MQIYEITGYQTGISKNGVNFLQPSDSFQNIEDGYVFRQVLQSRRGFKRFSTGPLTGAIADSSRVMGIFEHVIDFQDTELLAITKEFLYKYDEGTNTFLQIVNINNAPAGGFGIASNEYYVSGTSYPTKTGANRFVFTGIGMADTYYYDGTNVQSFTLDNGDFQNPSGVTLTNAHHVIYFGERLNLFNPTLNGSSNPQGMLYSAIRNSAGNGDKFNTSGAGQLNADTYQYISGASVLGDEILINFNRSNWIINKTRDNFNPYFIRKIPSELGSDAPFSTVNWRGENVSIGKTGIISTNGSQSGRVDSKIPAFIEDEFFSPKIDYTYGGFDRFNTQFLFSYISTDNSGETQDKVLVKNYVDNSWAVFNQRFSCFGQTDKGQTLTWDDIYENNDPSWLEWDTTEEIWNKIGVTETVQKTLAGDDNGNIYQLNQDNDDYYLAITAITQAAQAVITVGAHSFEVGDNVIVENVEGMTTINNFDPENPNEFVNAYEVMAIGATTVTINFVSTEEDVYTTAGTLSKIIDFKAELIPFNPFRDQGRKVRVSHVEFLLDANNGFLIVDVFQDGETTPLKSNVLIKPTSTRKDREWVTLIINQESDFITMNLRQSSPSVQVRQSSMRIHCEPGALTSG